MIQQIHEAKYGKQDLGEPDASTTNSPSGSTDGTAPAINQPKAKPDVATALPASPKLSRQEKWRRKNKKACAAYMKSWRARQKG